jgi:NAD(P)-dependent dehydrogenase (short-subunit alcohol dehydrogenase family)
MWLARPGGIPSDGDDERGHDDQREQRNEANGQDSHAVSDPSRSQEICRHATLLRARCRTKLRGTMLFKDQVAMVTGAGQGIGKETRGAFLEITPADWQRQLDVNLSGTFYCMQAAAREMATRGYGRIVNLSSVAGLIGPIDLAAYGTSKAGVTGLTRAAALDLADQGITVNAIAPGPIETQLMLGAWSQEALRERPQHGAIARFGTVEEIAHTALFLAAPASGFITGITLPVDGGAVAAGAYMVEKYRRRKSAAGED